MRFEKQIGEATVIAAGAELLAAAAELMTAER